MIRFIMKYVLIKMYLRYIYIYICTVLKVILYYGIYYSYKLESIIRQIKKVSVFQAA